MLKKLQIKIISRSQMKRKELSLCEVHELFTEKTFTWSVFRSRTNIETSTPDLPNAFANRFAATAAPPVNSEVFNINIFMTSLLFSNNHFYLHLCVLCNSYLPISLKIIYLILSILLEYTY